MTLGRTWTMQRWTSAAAAALLVVGAAGAVAAQSVTVNAASLDRKLGFRPGDQEPNWISYSDCSGDDELYFETTLVSAVGYSLEVWVGSSADCTTYDARLGSSPTCWQVYKTSPQSTTQKVTLRAQDLIAQNKSTDTTWGPGTGTLADCEDGTGQPVGTGSSYQTKYDLVGPPAPTGVSAGVGEELLVVSWDASSASDLIGYRVYCDPKPGALSPASSPMADAGLAGAAGSDAGVGGAGGAAGTDGGTSDAGSDAATATGGTGGTGGSGGGSAGNPACPSDALTPGLRPDKSYLCGSVTSKTATSTEATGLVNGAKYAAAVAGFDRVGNSGPLSSVACGSPQPVDDFFELYRRAGGKGGGGFCSVGRAQEGDLLLLSGLALGAWVLRRRRRSA
jgi:hypothetical protein